MLIGIDVGGTYTDGVLFEGSSIVSNVKVPTEEANLKASLLQVLDKLLKVGKKEKIKRIVLSTTLVTNLLATRKGERTALLLLPGYGLPQQAYSISPDTYFLKGSVDFRGRIIEPPDENEIRSVLREIESLGIKRVAVAAKFANRNNEHERLIRKIIEKEHPDISVVISSEISGKLNFPRRALTTYFAAMTLREWNRFAGDIEQAIRERNIDADIHILKADGGTILLNASRGKPYETVFSGPAASTMGAVALTRDSLNSVVLDIGGTTTDISLIIEGKPLYASKGARIGGRYTHINAFAVKSIPLGGDSVVWCDGYANEDSSIRVGPQRKGVAACFGGNQPTVTDVFNYSFDLKLGKPELSAAKLDELAQKVKLATADLCANIVEMVIDHLISAVKDMFKEWENEPAYKVWEIVHGRKFRLNRLIGIGAASEAIIPLVAKKMNVDCLIHKYSPVANALGACVVRPTLAVELHIDTQNNFFTVDPGGYRESLNKRGNLQLEDAKELAREYLRKIGQERGMEEYANDFQFYMEEQFNIIRGWDRAGKLFDIGIQVSPGFINEYKGVEA